MQTSDFWYDLPPSYIAQKPVEPRDSAHLLVLDRPTGALEHRAFRDIVQKWAKASLSTSLWAISYWKRVRPRCSSDSHAYRCLANRWLAIAWTLWQKRETYDEAYHLQQRARRSKPRR